jgi:nicotinate dehydrogenase subunit B
MNPELEALARRTISRRAFLRDTGLLVVGFSLAGCVQSGARQVEPAPTPASPATAVATAVAEQAPAQRSAAPPPSLTAGQVQWAGRAGANQVDSWLAIAPDGGVTVYSGRVELGTGVQTALAQIAAEELDVALERVRMVMGDTAQTPDEGYTAGSKTIQNSGVVLRKAAAEARQVLVGLASERLGVPADQLSVQDGVVSPRSDPSKAVGYGDLIGSQRFSRAVSNQVATKKPDDYAIVGTSVPRLDLPGKLTGAVSYVQDLRVPGMLHGRVVRPSGVGATLQSIDESSVQGLPGLVRVVRSGSFVGVVAEREEQAIAATRRLQVTWQEQAGLPRLEDLFSYLRGLPTSDRVLVNEGDVEAGPRSAAQTVEATYHQPYQMHASIGPSCAVADVRPDKVTVWSSTQGVYPLRNALAQLLGVQPETVHVIHMEGAGCYGHNGFDDAAGDAVLLSRAVGQPVRVQWTRQDEHAWEPKGPAMVMELRGGVDDRGNVVAWDYGVWSPTHSTRPGGAANLLPGQLVESAASRAGGGGGGGGGDRNARTNYTFKNHRVTSHRLATSPLRVSALRSLGGAPNTFANESFMDELATAAQVDPVELRLRHLDDPRAQAVIRAAADRAGWQARPSPDGSQRGSPVASGRGMAFARYENDGAYVATVASVAVDRTSGQVRVRRVVTAHDAGLIVNPDGIANQIEGNVIQSTSRALKEQVTFDQDRVTSVDWASYPILTFPEIPEIEVVLIDHPDQPAMGAGEPSTLPTAPAIANAIFDATGARLRALPMTPDRVKAALG